MQRVFGEDDEVHGRQAAACLGDHGADFLGLPLQIGLGGDDRKLELDEADDDPVPRLVQAPETAHALPQKRL